MTDTQALRDIIQGQGLKLGYVAEACGFKRATFMRKLNNESSFTVDEVPRVCRVLGLSNADRDRIFFWSNVGGK
jgi:DNA-binding phage protein